MNMRFHLSPFVKEDDYRERFLKELFQWYKREGRKRIRWFRRRNNVWFFKKGRTNLKKKKRIRRDKQYILIKAINTKISEGKEKKNLEIQKLLTWNIIKKVFQRIRKLGTNLVFLSTLAEIRSRKHNTWYVALYQDQSSPHRRWNILVRLSNTMAIQILLSLVFWKKRN